MMGLAGKFIDFFELQREPDGGAGVAWWFRARFLILFDTLYARWKIRAGGHEWIRIGRFQIHRAKQISGSGECYVDINVNVFNGTEVPPMIRRDSLASISGP